MGQQGMGRAQGQPKVTLNGWAAACLHPTQQVFRLFLGRAAGACPGRKSPLAAHDALAGP